MHKIIITSFGYNSSMQLTDQNYHDIIKNNETPVFVDFYSPSCGPCQILTQFIDEHLEHYGKERGVTVVKCNVASNPKLASAFNISSVPMTIAVLPGEKLKYAELGLKDEIYYFSLIDKLSGKGGFLSKIFG
jgi:thioredoxin 1